MWSMEPKDQSEPTSMATASAMPRMPLAVRRGQWERWRIEMTLDWRTNPVRSMWPPRILRYRGGAGGAMATAGDSQATARDGAYRTGQRGHHRHARRQWHRPPDFG